MEKIRLIRKIYRKIVPVFVRKIIGQIRTKGGREYYYGQDGEDVLLRLFCMKPDAQGFYVDIGAFHPRWLSNTQWFYERGWHGINIDANPCAMKKFNKKRKRDINIVSGVSDIEGTMDYYYFGETDAINTFNAETYKSFVIKYKREAKEIKKVRVRPINDILEEYLPQNQHIDFIDIDVEGFEMKILSTFNFNKYAPDFFLVESHEFSEDGIDFMEFASSSLYKFMKEKGYIVVAKTRLTIVFKRIK